MNHELRAYIEANKVTAADFLLFRNWEEFLHMLFSHGGHVEMIVWYEYCRIGQQKIGTGGYRDPERPGWMWAETHFYNADLQQKTISELLSLIAEMRANYPEYDLYPEFYTE